MPLAKTDLLLKEEELKQLTDALANLGIGEPIDQKALEAAQVFTRYTSRYVIETEDAKRLQRAIIIYELYALIGGVTKTIEDNYKAAMLELKDIRDGKFSNLELAPEQPTNTAGGGGWGSKTKINFPGDSCE